MTLNTAIKAVAFLILLTASLPALSDSKMFVIDMKVIEDGVELATPRMLVKEGADASMGYSGKDAVAIGLIVSDAGAGETHILAEVETAGGQMSPELLMREDKWGSVTTGDLEFHIRVREHVANE